MDGLTDGLMDGFGWLDGWLRMASDGFGGTAMKKIFLEIFFSSRWTNYESIYSDNLLRFLIGSYLNLLYKIGR